MIIFFVSCEKQPASPVLGENGKLIIRLTDAPAAYDAVNITFSKISVHLDNEWVNIDTGSQTIDLLQWNNGKSIIIGEAEVHAGHYSQIRLIISDADIVVDGITYPINVPSGAQTGLKFGPGFDILPGYSYELVVDFDAKRSIVTTGPPPNPNGYKLKPRIRVVPKAITGAITGIVATNQTDGKLHLPEAYAIVDTDTITSAEVDTTTGYFILSFLPESLTYKVSIQDTLNNRYEKDDVVVTAGSTTDLQTVELK